MSNSALNRAIEVDPTIERDPTPKLGGDLNANDKQITAIKKIAINQTGVDDSLLVQDGGVTVAEIYDGGIVDLPKQSGCRVHRSATQSISANTWTKVEFDVEDWDTQSEFDPTTNYRFTATKPGKYLVTFSLGYNAVADGTRIDGAVSVNGTKVESGTTYAAAGSSYPTVAVSAIINIGTTGDYIECETLCSDSYDLGYDNKYTWVDIIKLNQEAI